MSFFTNSIREKEIYAMWDPYADFRKLTLPNGLDVYVSQVDREFEIFGFLIHAGAREDAVGKDGVAHFVEHCVSKGIPDLTPEKIHNFFEKQGGFANLGSTDYLKTSYMCKCRATPQDLKRSLEIFGQMLLKPDLSIGINREREIIVQEYNQAYSYNFLPELILQVRRSVFPGHRLANFLRPLGHLSAIQAMTQSDLEEFHGQYYSPSNMSVVAIGKLSPAEIFRYLEQSPFGAKRTGTRNGIAPLGFPDYSSLARFDVKWSLLLGTNEENSLTRGQYESLAALPGNLAEPAVIFTKNLLERMLFKKIREERGWCYSLDVSCNTLQDIYEFYVEIPLMIKALPHIEELVDQCIATALDDRIFFDELKEIAINEVLLLDRAFEKICWGVLSDIGECGRIITNAEDLKNCETITVDSVAEVLDCLKPEKRMTVITYP